MRSQSGMTLLEMVVAVGLSGVFVCLLSGLLGQTLALSSASQNELIANNAADVLLENAKSTPFQTLAQNYINQPLTLIVNRTTAGMNGTPPRTSPVQLDLTDPNSVYGTVNGGTGIIDTTKQWQLNKGNYFRGTATEVVEDGSPWTSLPTGQSLRITVTIDYQGATATASNSTTNKSIKRQAFLFANGAAF